MFILLLQTIWLFIAELAGKDLDFSIILKFLLFATPRLIPMVLPLSILLTSIMIFGNFAENYEFAAMKSSGISLQRAMKTLSVLVIFIGIGAFLFANTVIPNSEKRFINLRKNIVKVKPAMVITQNQFNDLGSINIKVSEKYGDNDQFLKDIIIHKKSARPGNYTVIKATDGELRGSVDSDLITLILNDGNYYEDIQQKSIKSKNKIPFAKAYFKQYNLNIDLSELDNVDMDAQQYSKGFNMLNVSELKAEIDTVSSKVNKEIKQTKQEIGRKSGLSHLNNDLKISNLDTIPRASCDSLDLITERFDLKEQKQIYNLAISNVDGVLRTLENTQRTLKIKRRGLNKYEMSLHDKYVLGIACVLLFFVGAPLGAIIRKGGLGTPIVMGVMFFLTYHFIGIFAKNGAEEGGIPPFVGSWIATWIIFPLSIFLTYRATTDRGFVSVGNYIQPVISFFWKKKGSDAEMSMAEEEAYIQKKISVVNTGGEVYKLISGYDIDQLKDLVRNYRQYEYSQEYKFASLRILLDKGISIDEMRMEGKLENNQLRDAETCLGKFDLYSVLMVVFSFLLGGVFISLQAKKSELLIPIILLVVIGTAYCIMAFNSIKSFDQFYKILKDTIHPPGKVIFFLGILVFNAYLFAYLFYRKGMKRDIKMIR